MKKIVIFINRYIAEDDNSFELSELKSAIVVAIISAVCLVAFCAL